MSKLMLDPELRKKLNGLNEQLEVCDENGMTIGRFVPEVVYRKMVYTLAEAQCPPIDADERARRRQELGGRSWTEILANLENS